MLSGTSALTANQIGTFKTWYLQPYLEIIKDATESLDVNILKQLVGIITKKELSADQKSLPIGEGIAQVDDELKLAILNITDQLSKSDFDIVYDALYVLLHQCRLNKSPDSPYADDHNASMIAQYQDLDKLYENTYHKKGNVSLKLKVNGIEPTSQGIEAGFIVAINDVLAEMLEEKADEAVSTTISSPLPLSSSSSGASKRVREEDFQYDEDEEIAAAIALSLATPSLLVQFENKQEQEESDRRLAIDLDNQIKDEMLARQILEEEDAKFVRKEAKRLRY